MRALRTFVRRGLRLGQWCLQQPRERWLIRQAVRRIRVAHGAAPSARLVVLIADAVGSRICKLAYGLKATGWKTVLLHQGPLPADPAKCFDETRRYATPAHALLLATEFQPVAYHVFSNWNFDVATLLIRHRPGKIVFDNYDVLAGTLLPRFQQIYRREIALERFCLENADGLCCRDLESQCVKRMGYRFRGARILVLDCCWGDEPSARPDRVAARDEFHVVNCGNIPVATEPEWAVHRREITAVAEKIGAHGLAARHLHYHVYPMHGLWPPARDEAPATLASGSVRLHFHFHEPVPPDQLQATLMRYDAGLYHVGVGVGEPPTYNHWKFVYTSGNRVFDYLDAELPVIVHGSTLMEFVARRAHADIRVEDRALGEAARRYLRGEDTTMLRRNAAEGRRRFAAAAHAPRLAAFYQSL